MNLLIIQLKRNELVFANFRSKRGELSFIEAARHPLSQEDSLPVLLQEFAAKKAEERRVILAIPSNHLFMREMELPIADRRKVRELLPLELKGETAVDTDQLVFDALPLTEGKVLAVWAKHHWLQETIALLVEKGLEPEIVTASLFNWQSLIPAEAGTGTVALTDGESLVVYQDKKPIFFRVLAGGESETARTLAAVEIAKGTAVERAFAHGGHSRQDAPGTSPAAASISPLAIDGEFAETFAGDADAARDLAGAYAVARAVIAGDAINLRSGDLAYTAGTAKTRKKLRLSMILAGCVVALLFAEAGLRWYLVKKDLDSLNSSINKIYREVFPTRKKAVDEVAELRSEIKRLNSGKASSNTLIVLKTLAEAKGDDIFGVFEAEIDGNQVRLKGDAKSFQAVNDFKTKSASLLSGAEVSETKSKPDGSVTFVLRGTLKEGTI
ncbi:type II secretion system protein GspL [Geotalea toluenoxydans]